MKGATQNIKEILKNKYWREGYGVGDEKSVRAAEKTLTIYFGFVKDLMEMTRLIRQYNEFDFVKRNKWQLNIPEKEFHFGLKQAGLHWKERILKNS